MEEKIFVTRSSMPPYEEFAEAIKPLWDSHWLTNMGCWHKELEEKLRDYLILRTLKYAKEFKKSTISQIKNGIGTSFLL